MGVSNSEYKRLWVRNNTAEVISRDAFGDISGIKLRVKGIRGGKGRRSRETLWYTVFIDVETIRSDNIPRVWVMSPSEDAIKHVNIFHPIRCAKLGVDLPMICWGDYKREWANTPKYNRTLVSLVHRLEFVLSDQNFNSPVPGR